MSSSNYRPSGIKIGIAAKIAITAWLLALATLVAFVGMTIPQQKQTFLENLRSKAHSVAVALYDVAAGAAINDDLASVVNACQTLLSGDPELSFLVITRNDGFSLVSQQSGWRVEPEIDAYWRPLNRHASGAIASLPLFDQRVYHYGQPFDYSGIQWGWIHIGLSLEGYDHNVAALYRNTLLLSLGCIFLSLLISVIYASRLVRPILRLRQVVHRIAGGDFSVRADVARQDELGNLAVSVNSMTEALLRRDRILESVRFSAQQFVQTGQWQTAIDQVLARLGRSSDTSRAYLFKNHTDDAGRLCCSMLHEWTRPGIAPQKANPELQAVAYADCGLDRWAQLLGRGESISGPVAEFSAAERAMLEPQGIQALLIMPVFVDYQWWGFIGLDDCVLVRDWPEAEKDSLRAAADMIGAAIARQRIQDDLVIAKEGAEQASRTKSEFLANMSHELRTPLNHIIGFTELVLSGDFGRLSAEQEEFLNDVLGSGRHLLSLINDVLDLAKVEAGKMELALAPVRIRELLENSLVMVKEKALKHQLQLAVDVQGVPEEVPADERKLKQVVYNLLSNAVKFTPEGGRVHLGARIQAGSELDGFAVPADGNGHGQWLSVWVADTGIGLAPENLARVFSPFEQVEGSASRKYQGTGLGLSLTRKMVELHGGAIWAESAGAGQGSTFRFAIPLGQAPAAESAAG